MRLYDDEFPQAHQLRIFQQLLLYRRGCAMRNQPSLERLRAEFLEMPGLRLTADQVHRLCGIDTPACSEVLDELVHEHFLCRKPDGRYARMSDGRPPTES
jgi:hypothetical protein